MAKKNVTKKEPVASKPAPAPARTTTEESPYSLQSAINFINNNFGLLLMMTLFFIGGFFVGSLWTENQLLKNGGLGGGGNNNVVAASPAPVDGQPANTLTRENFIAWADDVGVKKGDMEKCIDSKKHAQTIADQMAKGSAAGVTGTPGTIVVVNGVPKEIISGAVPVADAKLVIDKYLNDPNATPSPNTGLVADQFAAISDSDHIRGNKNAGVILVEYSDYECPFCRRFHPTMLQLSKDYGNKISWIYRHYPLSFHPSAQPSAEAAECVAELKGNDAFWEFSDKMFEG